MDKLESHKGHMRNAQVYPKPLNSDEIQDIYNEHGDYYLADDVDKRIEDLEQRNKDLERALRMSTCKFDTDNDGNCHLCVGKGC